jgi:hypothetical protein
MKPCFGVAQYAITAMYLSNQIKYRYICAVSKCSTADRQKNKERDRKCDLSHMVTQNS